MKLEVIQSYPGRIISVDRQQETRIDIGYSKGVSASFIQLLGSTHMFPNYLLSNSVTTSLSFPENNESIMVGLGR